jgi:alginate O-acetyltransferase complex protein AlgI
MLFNSTAFIFFFILVTTLYYVLPHNTRWAMLLTASCYFYMAFEPIYILILAFTIVIDYFAGIAIENAKGKQRKLLLLISIFANIGILAVFKYYNFFNDIISDTLNLFKFKNNISYLSILLPIGLSFHTFQAMSYTIEVYRGNQKAEKHFGIYSLYVMFYPQLVAGPIERPQNLLPQFHTKHAFEMKNLEAGFKKMLFGFFKKLVIADRLSIYVDAVFNNSTHHTGTSLAVATIFFAFQIYCDFSGYSDIAIGAAKMMGIDLMTNFRRPYLSSSISEFWSRWHISLSTWFKDYFYISLGGNRVGIPRWYFNLFFVFLISGLWHGANWTFLMWGSINGVYLILALMRDRVFSKLHLPSAPFKNSFVNLLNILITFILICISWIFFRANNISQANRIIYQIFTDHGIIFFDIDLIYGGLAILFLLIFEWIQEKECNRLQFMNSPSTWVRFFSYSLMITAIMAFGVFDGAQFIYFQF